MYIIVIVLGLAALTQVLAKDEKIMGGYDTDILDHPYQVAIEERYIGQICGGALIARNLVLTAAHCLGKLPEFYTVRAGTTYREYGGLRVDVEKYVNHPKYGFGESQEDYDISVIQVTDGFCLGLHIQTIEMISDNSINQDDYSANFTGWGRERGEYYAARVLQAVSMKHTSKTRCAQTFENLKKTITNRMMCFSLYNPITYTGICKGDGGGPLVDSNKLIGIASWFGCYRDEYPEIFVDIGNYEIYSFILNYIADLGDKVLN